MAANPADVVENVTQNMDLLRFATAGSVDDGKSTLIGRLLLDSKSIFEDQLEAVEATSKGKGYDYTDLALLTDGLRSEREQGITIDVAYRYFATPTRKFIIADTPGHVQYTRNMVTGASTADLGLVLVDARQGLTEQSRRHAVILSLLRVPHLVLAVNKMDLVDFDEKIYEKIHDEFTQFATKLSIPDLEVIPISALQGDNVVNRSENMPWYSGPTLMHHLEHVHVASDRDLIDARFPVQYVVRPKSDEFHDYRGYAGQVAGGVLKPGDEVVVLPSGMTSRISKIEIFDREIPEAFPPMSVTVSLEDDVDVSRGDMIARVKNAPAPSQDIDAMVCWMTNVPLKPRQKLAIKHTTRTARALVKDVLYRLDINSLHRDQEAGELALNEIGRVQLRTTVPLLADPYAKNRTTGSFILIDEASGVTVGAGMIITPS
jgi:bifunctional enzyme CysN/CysC/sulfate adenylyltransferase subunit 1